MTLSSAANGGGCSQGNGRATETVCPFRAHHASHENDVDCVQETGGPCRVRQWERHIRLSRIDPLLDEIALGVLGDQTQDSQKTTASHQEVAMAMVSHQSARAAEIPVPDALLEVARAFPILRYSGELPPVGGGTSFCGKSVAVLAESAK